MKTLHLSALIAILQTREISINSNLSILTLLLALIYIALYTRKSLTQSVHRIGQGGKTKMAREKLTAGRIAGYQCDAGKGQSFLWDKTVPSLAIRATSNGAKAYIYQGKLSGKDIRITIGAPSTWTIEAAQAEARRLQTMVDVGQDPRQIRNDAKEASQAARVAKAAAAVEREKQIARDAVTLGAVWLEYIADRSPHWSANTLLAHQRAMNSGGKKNRRRPLLTVPGPLYSLASTRLADLSQETIEGWAKIEGHARASSARLAMRLLSGCLNWCSEQKAYKPIIKDKATNSKKARELLGSPKKRNDVLSREQLRAWFEAVRQVGNPVASAYLQILLLTGARRRELSGMRWADVDFQWNSLKLMDKIEDFRLLPMTPYVKSLLSGLPRRNGWVFSSPSSASGNLIAPDTVHKPALMVAGLEGLTLHGLRRSFASLSEWVEVPAGIAAQLQGHAPQGVREQNYIRRPLDLLRMWHVKIEAWILEQAGITFQEDAPGLRVVKNSAI
jgi:integrase